MITESNAIEVGFPQISSILDNEIHEHPGLLRLESQVNSLLNRVSALEQELCEYRRERECGKPSAANSVSGQLLASIETQASFDDFMGVAEEPKIAVNEPVNEEGVACLKRQLHEQLRSAELEMSLERARVFQQRAELEELKIQLAHDRSNNESPVELNPESRLDRHVSFLRRLTVGE